MDGFHLPNERWSSSGCESERAPATFDAEGYASLLARLSAADEPVVTAPEFRRDLDSIEAPSASRATSRWS